jgi:hypothetical protein
MSKQDSGQRLNARALWPTPTGLGGRDPCGRGGPPAMHRLRGVNFGNTPAFIDRFFAAALTFANAAVHLDYNSR